MQVDFLTGHVDCASHGRCGRPVYFVHGVSLCAVGEEQDAGVGAGCRRTEVDLSVAVHLDGCATGEIDGDAGTVDDGICVDLQRTTGDHIGSCRHRGCAVD